LAAADMFLGMKFGELTLPLRSFSLFV